MFLVWLVLGKDVAVRGIGLRFPKDAQKLSDRLLSWDVNLDIDDVLEQTCKSRQTYGIKLCITSKLFDELLKPGT